MASSRSLRSRVVRFAQVDRPERQAVLAALGLLPPITLALHVGGMERARALGAQLANALPALEPRLPARRVAVIVESVAAALSDCGVPRVTCLARSLALCALLERRGELPRLQLGVPLAPLRAGFEAHAWVELDGVVLNDTNDVRGRYAGLVAA